MKCMCYEASCLDRSPSHLPINFFQVVPNLVVFDASGIAGSMAGKGTLWLASFFEERKAMGL